jgi:hypothetical protein
LLSIEARLATKGKGLFVSSCISSAIFSLSWGGFINVLTLSVNPRNGVASRQFFCKVQRTETMQSGFPHCFCIAYFFAGEYSFF